MASKDVSRNRYVCVFPEGVMYYDEQVEEDSSLLDTEEFWEKVVLSEGLNYVELTNGLTLVIEVDFWMNTWERSVFETEGV